MKKLTVLFYLLVCVTVISCTNQENSNLNISFKESGHYYSMNAHFTKSKTREVERYLHKKFRRGSNMSFANMQSDATFTLDDKTKFYMRKAPGHIKIKLDKDENSYESYYRVKTVCEGIKKILTN